MKKVKYLVQKAIKQFQNNGGRVLQHMWDLSGLGTYGIGSTPIKSVW